MSRRSVLGTAVALAGGLSGLGAAFAQSNASDPAATLTELLSRYVSTHGDGINRVAYASWRAAAADLARLDAAITAFAQQAPSRMTRNEAFAYWANLYNAITLKVVLARYPVASIRDIRSEGVLLDPRALTGPWRSKRISVEGRRLSLDDIENVVLRPLVRDPRVHYAINCAALGCPNLQPAAWRAESLDEDLDRAARAFVNTSRAVTVRPDGALRVSSIYVWFRGDFGGSDASVIAHLRRYANPTLTQRLAAASRIAGHGYDWAINTA